MIHLMGLLLNTKDIAMLSIIIRHFQAKGNLRSICVDELFYGPNGEILEVVARRADA